MARRTLRGEDRLAIEHAAATRRQPLTARRGINIAGGVLLIIIGVLMVTGLWSIIMSELGAVIGGFSTPL